MDDQNKNLILAIALSGLVMLVWLTFFAPEAPVQDPADTTATSQVVPAEGVAPPSDSPAVVAEAPPTEPTPDAPRLMIETPSLTGSISLLGARFDDLTLANYLDTQDADSENVTLLTPIGTDNAYYALFGWFPAGGTTSADLPNQTTLWEIESGDVLTPDSPVTLAWDNGAGLTFHRDISIDENYMFAISQTVENSTDDAVRMGAYGQIARHGEPDNLKGFFIIHEGTIRMTDGELNETDYDDIVDFEFVEREGANAELIGVEEAGWIGFTDHYWMTTLIPDAGQPFTAVERYIEQRDIYLTETRQAALTIEPGATATVSSRFFAGAKEWETIRNYQDDEDIGGFLDSIDWGWFFFLTKPIFSALHLLNSFIGNMGWSIIALTLLIKALVLPLAYKSYVSMARMKEIQPEMELMKERAGDDKQKLQQEMMKLYKEKKVNPAAGCLPILIQIPIFFSLYKVIFVTLELRHAPWLGWIRDLSAPDPSSILNLFGLLSYAPPDPNSLFAIFSLGILPILLGISMWLQQKLNPAPTDGTQAMIFAWMPWIFMFMLGQFASGLVLYWIANNTITFMQQYAIMRSQGYTPDVFGNIRTSLKRKKAEKDK